MKLHRGCDVLPNDTGLVCRQTRLGGVAMAALFTVLLAGLPIFAWWRHGPLILIVPGGLLAALIVPLLWGDVRNRYRKTNWVLWIRPDGIWINLRSYQDRGEQNSPSVLELSYRDIVQAQRRVEHYSVPGSDGGSVACKLESLDLELREQDTSELASVIADDRRRRQPERTQLGFIRSTSKVTLRSISLPDANRIRIAWHGGQGHGVSPRLRRVLKLPAGHVHIAEPATDRRPDWSKLADAELDDQILSLVCAGDRMSAIKLLVRRRGYTITQAHEFVDGLTDRV